MAASHKTVAKLCPRCGAFYQDLTSKTCPQCFAKLEELSDDEALNLSAEQEARSRDPEYIEAKQREDEQFKEQAFGACLGVVGITIVTLIVCVVLIIVAVHRHNHAPQHPTETHAPIASISNEVLPRDFDRIVPKHFAGYIRTAADADFALPGTVIRVYHGSYGTNAQIYAVPNGQITDTQQNTLRLAVDFAAQQHHPALVDQVSMTAAAYYIVLGKNSAATSKLIAVLPQTPDGE